MAAASTGLLARLRRTRPESAARHESFLIYRDGFYLKLALALCAISIVLYAVHDPAGGRRGGSWLGYTLGAVAAGLVFWLAWFGVRKRQFKQARAAAQDWVSAHVYLGLALVVVATLHCAFHFGWNVHTLAYVLMLLVVVSGIYGIAAYATLPRKITGNRDGMEFRAMLEEIAQLNESALALAEKVDAETHAVVARSVGKVRIGGTAWEQLSGNYAPPGNSGDLDKLIALKRTQLAAGAAAKAAAKAARPAERGPNWRQATIAFVADQIFSAGGGRAAGPAAGGEMLQNLLQAIGKRNALLEKVQRDITLRARLNVWLFLHVPLSVALLAALLAHIFSVFFYW